ncbi:MAG: hypothetical protein QW566_10685, partial [Candidatus Jordarchaeales archaeon]
MLPVYIGPWSLQYLGSAIVSLSIAIHVLIKNKTSLLHALFFLFGLITSLRLFTGFFNMIILDSEIALKLFRLGNSLYFVSIALLLIFVRMLAGKKEGWLLFIPPMLIVTISGFIPYTVEWTDQGWKFVAGISIESALTAIYLFSYCILIIYELYQLRKNAKVRWLRIKYGFMLWSIIILQLFGVILFNALLLVWKDIPRIAGILYFLSFLAIWYGFQIQPPKEVVLTRMGNPLTDSYRKFLNKLIDVAPPDELGLKTMDLLEYL